MVPRRGGHDKSRIKSNHVTEPRKELWTNRFKTLNTLLDNKEFDQLNLHLKPIFEALNGKKQNAGKTPLDTNFDDKLAKICIKVIDCKQSVGPARHCAVKILAILVKLLSQEPDTRATLKLVYESLVKNLQPPKNHIAPEDYHLIQDDVKLKGLSAYCLNQIDSKLILTPTEAHGLIENSILPLASWCLTIETKQEESTYQLFGDNLRHIHKSHDDDDLLNKDSFRTYPRLICLLVALTKHSESSPSGGYRKQLYSMLSEAIEGGGKIKDEHIVALHVIEALDSIKMRLGYHTKIAMDLLGKSEGIYRSLIAFTVSSMFSFAVMATLGVIGGCLPSHEKYRTIFVTMMIDDLLTTDDELLAEVAIQSICRLEETVHNDELRKFVKGKEISIIKKLVELNLRPELYSRLLKHFDWFKDPQVSVEFDYLARLPISQNINKLVQSVRARRINDEQVEQLRESMRCLAHLLRLRRHRLELAEEVKLNEFIDSLVETKIEVVQADTLILFFFANSYQVHTSAWSTIIKLLQLPEQGLVGDDDRVIRHTFIRNPATTQKLLSHFLMIDGDRFYREFASIGVLELIHWNCESATAWNLYNGIDFFENLLREILLTYPDDYRSTKLNPREYQIIKGKFINWLIRALTVKTVNRKIAARSEPLLYWRGVRKETRKEYINLCSGLVAILNRHREILDVIADVSDLKYVQDSWLRGNISDWSRLIMEHKDYPDGVLGGFFPPVGLASVMAAKELYDCREFRKSPAALLEFIESSCDEGIQRAPVDSIMSKRYQQIKDSLFGP